MYKKISGFSDEIATNIIKQLKLPEIWDEKEKSWEERRKEIVDILCEEEYGFMPKMHDNLTWEEVSEEKNFCAGKVTLKKIMLTAYFGDESFSFPVYSSIPNKDGRHPFFVHINFSDNVPDRYLPVEEICDRGYAVLSFFYNDVALDEKKYPNRSEDKLKDILFKGVDKKSNHCGKIHMWAWAASRVMDYAQSLGCLNFEKAIIVGHSRLGKTALLAGALDERFSCAISNDSGCSGAAITRNKVGERVSNITEHFSYWFCDNYKKYIENEDKMPFDQHFLIAAMAPRKVYVASAKEDDWADPKSEFLACFAASEVYEKLGFKGLVTDDRFPEVGEWLHDGNIGYHIRSGKHYLSREDWNRFMDYLD